MGKIGSGTAGSKVTWDHAHRTFKGLNATRHPLEWPKHKTLAELSFVSGGRNKRYSHVERQSIISYKAKHTFTIQPSNWALGIDPMELKTYVYTETCTWILIAALFTIAKTSE